MSERLHFCQHAGTDHACESVEVPDVTAEKRRIRELTKCLRELVATNRRVAAAIDQEMKGPSTHERGQRMGQIVGALEMATDSASRYGLNMSWPAISKSKRFKVAK